MKEVCIIIGAASGMGLSASKLISQEENTVVVMADIPGKKLEEAVNDLKGKGRDVVAFGVDVCERASVQALANYSKTLGKIKKVLDPAGIGYFGGFSPQKVFEVSAMGTYYVDNIFGELMESGGCIVNVASGAAHMVSAYPEDIYKLAVENEEDAFHDTMIEKINTFPEEKRGQVAYGYAKNFIVWFSEKMAIRYGKKGVRVLSVTPGTFVTPLALQQPKGSLEYGAEAAALGRCGDPDEIAQVMAFMLSDRASYVTGCDIRCDGGVVAKSHDKNYYVF